MQKIKSWFVCVVVACLGWCLQAANSGAYYPNTLPTADTLIWRNVNLADLAGMDAYMNGGSLSATGTPMGGCYFWSYAAATTSATCQIQIWDGTYTKVCCVTLTQSDADVLGRVTRAAYSNKGTNILGQNMASGHNNQTIATSPSASGYGVFCLSPIFKNKPLTYDRGAFYTWAGGTSGDWLGAGAWRTSDNATTAWKDWALAKFPAAGGGIEHGPGSRIYTLPGNFAKHRYAWTIGKGKKPSPEDEYCLVIREGDDARFRVNGVSCFVR